MQSTPQTLFTIGHSNLSSDRFVDALRSQAIEVVVDVRSVPYSRFSPHFSKSSLQALLETAGIAYYFAGEQLGGRPKDPTCYKRGVLPSDAEDYLSLVNYDEVARREFFRQGIEHLLELTETQTVAIMCSEEDPDKCHRRHLVARNLPLEVRVVDIRTKPDGSVRAVPAEPVSQQLSLL